MLLTIELEEMQFYAYHGVLAQEQRVGNTYVVNLRLELNTLRSLGSDCLEDTINYAEVYEAIAEEMRSPSLLLEHVVGRIARRLMLDFGMIENLSIKLSKVKPPMSADIKASSVGFTLARQDLYAFLSIFAKDYADLR